MVNKRSLKNINMKNMKKIIVSLIAFFVFAAPVFMFSSSNVFAQTPFSNLREKAIEIKDKVIPQATEQFKERLSAFKESVNEARQEFRQEIEDKRTRVLEERQVLRNEWRERVGEIKNLSAGERDEALKIIIEERKNEFRERAEEWKRSFEEKRALWKANVETKRAELKEELQKIKDERKKQLVEKIDEQIAALNERMLNHFSKVLNQMETVLTNISTRADRAEARGVDTTGTRGAIEDTYAAIEVSRAAIEAQFDKVYTIEIGSEETLKVDVGEVRRMLHDDLESIRNTVKEAHDAIRSAAVMLAQSIPTTQVDDGSIEEPDNNNEGGEENGELEEEIE